MVKTKSVQKNIRFLSNHISTLKEGFIASHFDCIKKVSESLILAILILMLSGNCVAQSVNTQESPKDTTLAKQYLRMADSLTNQVEYDKAIELVLQAKDIFNDFGDRMNYISCYNTLARYHDYKFENETRIAYLEKAETLGREYMPASAPILANTFQQRAEIFIQEDMQDSAMVYLVKAQDLFHTEEDWEGIAWVNILMVISHYYQMNFSEMDSILQAVHTLDETHQFPPESEIKETVFQWQLLLYNETGEYENAFNIAKKTLDYRLLILNTPFDSSMLATNYHNLATFYQSKGDYDEAIRYLQLALDVHMKIDAEPWQIFDENLHIGLCLNDKNEYENALLYFRKGMEQFQYYPEDRKPGAQIEVYTAIGRSSIEVQQLDTAIYYLNKALELSRNENYNEDIVLLNLGLAYREKKDFDRAIIYFSESVEVNKKTYGEYHPYQIDLYQHLGEMYYLKEEWTSALHFFQKALKMLDKNFVSEDYYENPQPENVVDKLRFLQVLQLKANTLSELYKTEEELIKVYASYQLATSLMDAIRRDYESEGAKKLLSSEGNSIYEKAIGTALALYDSNNIKDYLYDAFTYSEKNKALLLLESVKNLEFADTYDNPDFDSLQNTVRTLKLDIVFYERKLFEERQKKNPNVLKIKNWEAELVRVRSDYERLRYQLEKDFPDYYQLNFVASAASVDDIQKELLQSPETVFLEYFMGDSTLYTFAITTSDFEVFRLDRSEKLDSTINAFLKQQSASLTSDDPEMIKTYFDSYTSGAYELYQHILEPALKDKEVKKLIIVPDGNLGYLSFEALLTEKAPAGAVSYNISNLQFLIKDYQLSYAYSATLSVESRNIRKSGALETYLGFAPVFDDGERLVAAERDCNDNRLGVLENSEQSIKRAMDLFKGKSFLHSEASKTNFLNNAPDYRLLHLSTHACVDDTDPMFNKIYFADDHLYTYELYNMQLNADLAVLSACQTGLGAYIRGEGIFSLARGFMQAGCPAIITSLWNANDYSTTQIMMDFHENLKNGQTKDEALRNAKLTYLENAPSRLSSPYYWATFVPIGNMDVVDLGDNPPLFWYVIGSLLFFAVFFLMKKRSLF